MTTPGSERLAEARGVRVRLVPPLRRPRGNDASTVILAVSFVLHAALLIPLFWTDTAAPKPVETPVEVIQEPPPSKTAAKGAGEDAKAAQEKAAQEKAAKDKAAQEKAAQEKAAQAKAEQQKADAAKVAQDKAAQEKAAQDKAEQAKVEQQKAEQAKAEQAKAEQARADEAKAQQEKAAAEKAAEQKAEQAKAQQAKAEQQKAEQAKAAQQKAAQEKAAQEKAQQDKAEQAKLQRQAKAQQKAEQAREKAAKQEAAKAQPQKVATQSRQPETQAEVDARMRSLLGLPPSLDGTALPGEGPNGTIDATYEQLVMSKLTKALSMDQHPGRPAYATVSFVVGDKGEVVRVVLERPSGDPILDGEATAVVNRAAPFPVPPPGTKREYTVTLQSKPVL